MHEYGFFHLDPHIHAYRLLADDLRYYWYQFSVLRLRIWVLIVGGYFSIDNRLPVLLIFSCDMYSRSADIGRYLRNWNQRYQYYQCFTNWPSTSFSPQPTLFGIGNPNMIQQAPNGAIFSNKMSVIKNNHWIELVRFDVSLDVRFFV